jgi:lipopolysaccharide export system permease protein
MPSSLPYYKSMKKTTYIYLFKETLPVFLIGIVIFTVILLMDKILKLIELIVNSSGGVTKFLMLLLFISPSFLVLTIPTAVLLATLLTFSRLSSDSEIIAFKASGMSLYQLFPPIAVFSCLACLFTSFLVFYGLPWGNRGFLATLYVIAQSKVNVEVKERVFNDDFDGLVVYVDKVPIQGRKMEGILIYDERDKEKINTILAKEGFLVSNPESREIILRLRNGDIQRFESKTNVFQKAQFETYDLRLELAKAFTNIAKKLKEHEMSIQEIRKKIEEMIIKGQDPTAEKVELHKRYAIPFACIVFGLIGVPLGIQPRRSGRSFGFIFSILILLIYYMSLIAFEILAVHKTIPPFLAGWAPNFLLGCLGTYLLIKAANESPFKPAVWLIETFNTLQRKWKGLIDDI